MFIESSVFILLPFSSVEESVEQMQYQLAELLTRKRVLEITRQYLEEESKRSPYFRYLEVSRNDSVFTRLEDASFILEFGVTLTEKQRYHCLVTRNPIDCQLYTIQSKTIIELMKTFADLYWEAELVSAAIDHHKFSIPAITDTINELSRDIEQTDFSIYIAIVDSASRDAEDEIENHYKEYTATQFIFRTNSSAHETYNFDLPLSISDRLLWYIDPQSTKFVDKKDIIEYNATLNHLNSFETNVSAALLKVDIHRRWFKPSVFGNVHLTLVS